jgi:trk system potassium uptake protein
VNILVLGCGRVGARVANNLSSRHQVTVVDWNSNAFDRLGAGFSGDTLVGNGIDVDVLREAGASASDLFLALTDGDNRNLMAAQIARQIGARRVLARVYDPVRAEIFARMGLDTISPTVVGAQRLFESVMNSGEER